MPRKIWKNGNGTAREFVIIMDVDKREVTEGWQEGGKEGGNAR